MIGYKIKTVSIVLLTAFIMISCKDDSGDSGGTFPGSIWGVWQEEGSDEGDEIGIYFTDKDMGSWDYFGDEYDQGDDCYSNYVIGSLVSRNGDNYRIKFDEMWIGEGENDEGVVTIRVNGDMLTLTGPDTEDYEVTYSKDSRSVSSMTQECSFGFKANPEFKSDKVLSLIK